MSKCSNTDFTYSKGSALRLGAHKSVTGYEFTIFVRNASEVKLCFYNKADKITDEIDLNNYKINSSLYSVNIEGDYSNVFSYKYFADGVELDDEYVFSSHSVRKYADVSDSRDKNCLYSDDFDWEEDEFLNIPYSDVIAYQLHVRGFTAHRSSKVNHKGTYLGIVEKIEYLKELGINQIVLMPAYEFDEIDRPDVALDHAVTLRSGAMQAVEPKVNYWGFKEGLYYKPKNTYAYKDAVNEFKYMVKSLHKAGIEVVMRFYFPDLFNMSEVTDVLRWWVSEYHVDGFFVMGSQIPYNLISSDIYLIDRKLYFNSYDFNNYKGVSECLNHNVCAVNKDFSIVMRKFLKSDENMLLDFTAKQRLNPSKCHVINFITDYEGFTLNDLVSYDYKHNEANGENNNDGSDFNYSWNCGAEGNTRKKSIRDVRIKQIKNALVFLLLSQGPPMLLAGDEFMNSQNGNNNAYCQDNETGWLVWKSNRDEQEILEFTKELIKLRKSYLILHSDKEFRIMDYKSLGFPDLSYHSDLAWTPNFEAYYRYIGIMLCGLYSQDGQDDFFYIAYNMHWEKHDFALPKLPKDKKWTAILSSRGSYKSSDFTIRDEELVNVPDRTILVLKSTDKNDGKVK